MNLKEIPGFLACWKTGSSYTVDPPVLNTDRDWLVLVLDIKAAMQWADDNGLECCMHQYGADVETGHTTQWAAYRSGDLNLVIQSDITLYVRSVAVTELAKTLNLADKEDRINLFRAVKFGVRGIGEDDIFLFGDSMIKDHLVPNMPFED